MGQSNLDGFGILVTGGGTGIGKACATSLVLSGASVTICGPGGGTGVTGAR